ncbi:thaumatin-like protein 1b [Abrus precatorius]|uniref:Thaumatin-like protein 1b n=1 Tax=Abrus precatorius TaxID=3816 RepID=A0A8B8M2C7_ABRPR|nr:thaumatin-like protein 1b [Abrus precatorius]
MVASTRFAITLGIIYLLQFLTGSDSVTFEVENKCSYPVWPGILSGIGTLPVSTTGFTLQRGESKIIPVPPGWSGRIWGRTLCSHDSTGKFSCITGDCGSSTIECSGGKAAPPVTLVEFNLNGTGGGGLDFFDASLVEGFNLPVKVEPRGGTATGSRGGKCRWTGCKVNLKACPTDLKVMRGGECVACKSECQSFGNSKFCCETPEKCKSSSYSEFFKSRCPRAIVYACDRASSNFNCAFADYYTITFCPTSSIELGNENYPAASGVENSGSNDGGSANILTVFYKFIRSALVSISITFTFTFTVMCGCIKRRSSDVSAEAQPSSVPAEAVTVSVPAEAVTAASPALSED